MYPLSAGSSFVSRTLAPIACAAGTPIIMATTSATKDAKRRKDICSPSSAASGVAARRSYATGIFAKG